MSRFGIDLLSVFALNPVDQIHLAADLGCGHISSAMTQFAINPDRAPPWSLRDDPALQKEVRAALRARSIAFALAEGHLVQAGHDIRERWADIALAAELGAQRVGSICLESDLERAKDQYALLAEFAQQHGLMVTLEFAPPHALGNFAQALAMVRHINRPNFRLTLDSMHFFRSGGSVADIAALDPALIGYAQLSDVPRKPAHPDYMQEAMFMRRAPGEGELPLAEFVAALPRDLPIGLEIPMRAKADAGVSPRDRLAPAVAAAQALLG